MPQPKRKNKMVRLIKKSTKPTKAHYPNVDEMNFLINNDLPLNYKNGRERFSKSNNGKDVK